MSRMLSPVSRPSRPTRSLAGSFLRLFLRPISKPAPRTVGNLPNVTPHESWLRESGSTSMSAECRRTLDRPLARPIQRRGVAALWPDAWLAGCKSTRNDGAVAILETATIDTESPALMIRRLKNVGSTLVRCALLVGLCAAALPTPATTMLALNAVQSRKMHGAASVPYDLPIDTTQSMAGTVTYEPRVIGAAHRVVFQFSGAITSPGSMTVVDETNVSVGAPAPAIAGVSSEEVIVTIPALADNKRVTISLLNINGIGLNATASLGFRVGDINNSGAVSAADISAIKTRTGQVTNGANFQYDLDTNGLITAADIVVAKARSGLFVVNLAPLVSAGSNQTITLPAGAALTGSASDDGLPNPPGALTLLWTRFSGPSAVTFGNAGAAVTTASFAGPGIYLLRLTASDGQLSRSADVTITVNPGVATSMTVGGLISPRAAGAAGTLTVTARDASASVATGYRGTVHFTSSDALAVLPADYQFSAADNGSHTFAATLTTAGSQSITATDTVSGSLSAAQSGIVVNGIVQPGLFQTVQAWNKDVSLLPPSVRSANIIAALQGFGGWGNGNRLQIDFSIALLYADSTTPRRTITTRPVGYCFGGPDCDALPIQMPIPLLGNTEGSPDYTCDAVNNDCHVLVVERSENKLYELYQATGDVGSFTAYGAFVWDLNKPYGNLLRGDQCTSADAAGLPMAALIPTAEEVAAGDVPHALRFILPNPRMKSSVYVRPATHAGGPSSTNPDAPPYGVHFRLKPSFDETPYNVSSRVILRAMKKYGMILSDGGNIALTFADDRLSTAKWATLGITAQTFNSIPVTQFDVVDLGGEIPLTFNCVRTP